MSTAFLAEHWQAAFRNLKLAAPPHDVFTNLLGRYGEPHRAYHTVQHLQECFTAFENASGRAQSPGAVALALFYHDAIYDTHARDNEEKSAELARQVLAGAGAGESIHSYVTDLILVTRHAAMPESDDQMLLVDIDLSILGATQERFDEYERQVRQEYSWVDDAIFRSVRSKILLEFLARPTIYSTTTFRNRLEHPARENLKRSIAALTA